jgi:hypothetical protein
MPAGNTEVFVQNAPIVVGGTPSQQQAYDGANASAYIRAMEAGRRAGQAERMRNRVAGATLKACMNDEGFIQVPASEISRYRAAIDQQD